MTECERVANRPGLGDRVYVRNASGGYLDAHGTGRPTRYPVLAEFDHYGSRWLRLGGKHNPYMRGFSFDVSADDCDLAED